MADWDRSYTREQAAYPLDTLRADKYWPPVSRIDSALGDRNLVCACPSSGDVRELTPVHRLQWQFRPVARSGSPDRPAQVARLEPPLDRLGPEPLGRTG